MAVDKNFVVKNGLEVNSDLIVADSTNKTVGIGSTIPEYTLEVVGGIGVTDIYAAGIVTAKQTLQVGSSGTVISAFESGLVGFGTTNPAYLVDVRTSTGATTGTTVLYVQGDATVTGNLNVAGDIQYDQVTGRELYISGLSTFVGMSTFKSDIFVAGVSTFVGVSTFHNDVHIGGNLNVTGDIVYDEVTGRNIYISGISTFVGVSSFSSSVYIAGITTTAADGGITTTGGQLYVGSDLSVSGVSTFSGALDAPNDQLYIDAHVGVGTTAADGAADPNNTKVLNVGIVTANYIYGDISGATGVSTAISAAVGVSSEGEFVGAGATIINFASSNTTAWDITTSGGIATATVTPGASLGMVIALGG